MISEPAAHSQGPAARTSSAVLGQVLLLKPSLKSPFFPEFGNVECGLCFFFPGIVKIRTVSYLNFGSIASYSSGGLSTFF